MKTKYLSGSERAIGKKNFLTFSLFNGLGFTLIGDTVASLLAIHFGATNLELGYIAACSQISGLIILFAPTLLENLNLVYVSGTAWLLRGLVCIFYGLTLFVSGHNTVVIILVVFTLFHIFRMIGYTTQFPIQRMVAKPDEIGDFSAKVAMNFNLMAVVAQVLSFAVLSIGALKGIHGLLILIFFGIIGNTISAMFIKRIPGRETISNPPGSNVFTVFARAVQDRNIVLTLLLSWLNNALLIFIIFAIPFLKKDAGLSSGLVFAYTLGVTIATMAACYALLPFLKRVGVRPFIIGSAFFMILIGLAWAFISPQAGFPVFLILGVATGFFSSVNTQTINALFLKVMPDDDRLGFSSMLRFSSAIMAIVTGLAAGALGDLGDHMQLPMFHSLSFTFFALAVTGALMFLFAFMLKEKGSISLTKSARLIFSPRLLRDMVDTYTLSTTASEEKKEVLLVSLGQSDTPLAVEELRRRLRTPLHVDRERVMRTLFFRPHTEMLDDLLSEALDPTAVNREAAIFALGAYPDERTREALHRILTEFNSHIRSIAIKSLGRIGDKSIVEDALRMFLDDTKSAPMRVNALIGLCEADPDEKFLSSVFTVAATLPGRNFRQSVFVLPSRYLGFDLPLEELYERENFNRGEGVRAFFDDSRELSVFEHYEALVVYAYDSADYPAVARFCRAALVREPESVKLLHTRAAVLALSDQNVDDVGALAMLYYSYQILKTAEQPSEETDDSKQTEM
jgi:hypothetical protein